MKTRPSSGAAAEPGGLWAESFADLAAQGADSLRVAEHAVRLWRELDAALAPTIGEAGVDALFVRSLFLLRRGHPWLASVHEVGFRPGEAPAFKASFAHQDRLLAASTSGALLATFQGLLITLIGSDLARRLLENPRESP